MLYFNFVKHLPLFNVTSGVDYETFSNLFVSISKWYQRRSDFYQWSIPFRYRWLKHTIFISVQTKNIDFTLSGIMILVEINSDYENPLHIENQTNSGMFECFKSITCTHVTIAIFVCNFGIFAINVSIWKVLLCTVLPAQGYDAVRQLMLYRDSRFDICLMGRRRADPNF